MKGKSSKFDEKATIAQLGNENTREAAFSAIIRQYGEQLYWHIRQMVFSHDDSNDILQNTFLKAWSNIDKFRGEAQLSTWLYRIAINETLTFLGKNRNTISIDSPEGEIAFQLEGDPYFDGDHSDALLQATPCLHNEILPGAEIRGDFTDIGHQRGRAESIVPHCRKKN